MSAHTIIIVAIILAVAHPIIMRIALELAHPARIRLAGLCSELLSSPHLNEKQKEAVENTVDTAFSGPFVALGAVCAPILLMMKLFGASFETPLDEVKDSEARMKIDQMIGLQVASLSAANPYFMLVIFSEMIVLVPFFLLAQLLGRTQYTISQNLRRLALLLENQHADQINIAWR